LRGINAMAVVDDAKHRRALVVRLRRIEGQLRAIQAMIEAGDDCERIVQQISASRHALDKAFFNVLACAIQSEGGAKAPADKRLRQAAELLAKFG
jgi:DNA-binding FrmR family transcriptional regulator